MTDLDAISCEFDAASLGMLTGSVTAGSFFAFNDQGGLAFMAGVLFVCAASFHGVSELLSTRDDAECAR